MCTNAAGDALNALHPAEGPTLTLEFGPYMVSVNNDPAPCFLLLQTFVVTLLVLASIIR